MALFGKKEFRFHEEDYYEAYEFLGFQEGKMVFLDKVVWDDDRSRRCSAFDIPNIKRFLEFLELGDPTQLLLRIVDYSMNPNRVPESGSHVLLETLDLYSKQDNYPRKYMGTIPTEKIGVNIFIKRDLPFVNSLEYVVSGALTVHTNLKYLI